MKVSVIMIDGQFREHTFGAEYFSKQDLPAEDFEVIWVEFYSKVPDAVRAQKNVRVITLNNPESKTYHSSYCFNRGIAEAKGELIVIPDADQIVRPNFLSELRKMHAGNDKLVVYAYRYDEAKQGELSGYSFDELEKKCRLKNPTNYGGCLSVKRKWLLEINGYEQHIVFESGFHANGLDMYTRFKNFGMSIMWSRELKMFHPWHPFTLANAKEYDDQVKVINWRKNNLNYLPFAGIDPQKNSSSDELSSILASTTKPKPV